MQLVEFICLLVILFDVFAKVMWMRPRYFLQDRWNIVKVVVIGVYLVDMVVGLIMVLSNVYVLRISRFFRVFFVVEKSRKLRKMMLHMGRSLVSIGTMLLFIGFILIFWSFFGLILFETTPVGAASFSGFGEAFVSVFILLTTANFPDIMMASYQHHPLYSLYFIGFLLFVLYFLLNALTAIVYNAYRTETQKEVTKGLATRRRALTMAFHELCDETESIDIDSWQRMMKYVRPKLSAYVVCVIFNMVSRRDKQGKVELPDFLNICDFIDLHFQTRIIEAERPHRLGRLCRSLLNTPWLNGLLSIVLLANAALAIVETYECSLTRCSPYSYVDVAFLVYFWLDVAMRWLGSGTQSYLSKGWNLFDLLTLIGWSIGLILAVALDEPSAVARWVLLLQALRLLRLLSTAHEFQMITSTFVSLMPSMVYYLALLFCIYYDYALLGMELFYGVLARPNPILEYMPYGQFNFWANNFDSMSSTFVLLFELMVVNNWIIPMEAVVSVTTPWSRLYFMSFFIITTVIVLNLIVAFIIEAFVVSRDQLSAAAVLQDRLNELLADAQERTPGTNEDLVVRPSTRIFQLWAQLFRPPTIDTERVVSTSPKSSKTDDDQARPLVAKPLPSSAISFADHPLRPAEFAPQYVPIRSIEIPRSPASGRALTRTVVDYMRQSPVIDDDMDQIHDRD